MVQVFEAWQASTGRTACKLDAKRRSVIAARLRDYPLDDVLDAVKGWERDPWEGRRQQNELGTLLRDAAHLEKFRDLARGARLTVAPEPSSPSSKPVIYPKTADVPAHYLDAIKAVGEHVRVASA